MKPRKLMIIGLTALFVGLKTHADEAPALDKARATYAALASYADTGEVTTEIGATASPLREHHTFRTAFRRSPRGYLFDFTKASADRVVIWADPAEFRTWWKSTGVTTEYRNPNNTPAINLSDFPTERAATKIPELLYPQAPLVGTLSHVADVKMEPSEQVAGHACFKLSARAFDQYGNTNHTVNSRSITVWIDAESGLIRQIREDNEAPAGQVSRITTRFEPTANPKLDEAAFAFTPPAP